MNQAFINKVKDQRKGVYLFGTTPPKQGHDEVKVAGIADKLVSRLAGFEYDGLIVYDIQDESSRISKPRPFPFKQTIDPVRYSCLLRRLTGKSVITYKSVTQRCVDSFGHWLDETEQVHQVNNIVLVGSPSSGGEISLSLPEAYQTVNKQVNDIFLGGVTIAERHVKKLDEHKRLLNKTRQGCQYFISQAVYDAKATIDLLTSYSALCEQQGVKPKRIILTFSPCGSDKTLEFINWLGISVPATVEDRVLNAKDTLAESVDVCVENLLYILECCGHLNVPLGLNIESLTNRKVEIDASVDLFKKLQHILQQHLAQSNQDNEVVHKLAV